MSDAQKQNPATKTPDAATALQWLNAARRLAQHEGPWPCRLADRAKAGQLLDAIAAGTVTISGTY